MKTPVYTGGRVVLNPTPKPRNIDPLRMILSVEQLYFPGFILYCRIEQMDKFLIGKGFFPISIFI
jgi:hypothetical protein